MENGFDQEELSSSIQSSDLEDEVARYAVPTIVSDRAIIAVMGSCDANAANAHTLLLDSGVIHSSYSEQALQSRYDLLCRQAQGMICSAPKTFL